MTNTYFYDETQQMDALRTWASVVFPGTGDNTPLRKVTTLMVVSLCDPLVQVAAAAMITKCAPSDGFDTVILGQNRAEGHMISLLEGAVSGWSKNLGAETTVRNAFANPQGREADAAVKSHMVRTQAAAALLLAWLHWTSLNYTSSSLLLQRARDLYVPNTSAEADRAIVAFQEFLSTVLDPRASCTAPPLWTTKIPMPPENGTLGDVRRD